MSDHQALRNFIVSDKDGRYETARPVSEKQILNAAKTIINRRYMRPGIVLNSPSVTQLCLMFHLSNYECEVFACLFLDNKHRVIAFEEMFRGTIGRAEVHPREVVKKALGHNASAVILAHNHPSGEPEPSYDDRIITQRLTKALTMVDIRVLDHIVIGGTKSVSFLDRGLI